MVRVEITATIIMTNQTAVVTHLRDGRVEEWKGGTLKSLTARKCDRKWFPLWLTSGLLIMQVGALKPANSPEGPPLLQVFAPEPSQWILPPAATLTDPEAEGDCVSFHLSFVLVLGSVPSPNLPLWL